jgi:diguanylate cyclase (GGDEF)-like protein
MDKVKKIIIISSENNVKEILNFCFDGWGYEVFLRDSLKPNDTEFVKKISPDVIVFDIQSARKEQLDICRMLKKDFATAFIPVIALINKRQLRSQLLSLEQGIDDYLIKPPDPLDLRIRIEMLIRRAQHSIHANPLTGLPGGKILEDILKEKLSAGGPFSFAYLDIDNFKYFNDVYGYHKGDRIILQTSHMLCSAIKNFGNDDDFISHIGGDDFAFISTLDKYEKICQGIIQNFDQIIPFHYSEADRKQGFIVARDRTRTIRNIPLMTLSIAVVNREYTSSFKSTIEISEKIAEIKRYLKTIPESKFMADRRDTKLPKIKSPQVNRRLKESAAYKPLGQILLERNALSQEHLDEALCIHWKKEVLLGEILKELGFINEEELQKALAVQKDTFAYTKPA